MINRVKLARKVTKGLAKLPRHITAKLQGWVAGVQLLGLEEIRKIPGYHDEPLAGDRLGQRSIRLSREWRAYYTIEGDQVQCVLVIEVNHHDY